MRYVHPMNSPSADFVFSGIGVQWFGILFVLYGIGLALFTATTRK